MNGTRSYRKALLKRYGWPACAVLLSCVVEPYAAAQQGPQQQQRVATIILDTPPKNLRPLPQRVLQGRVVTKDARVLRAPSFPSRTPEHLSLRSS
jgi:hypothetical protein